MSKQFNAEDFIEASKQIERDMEKAFNGYKRSTKGKLLFNPKGKKHHYTIELSIREIDGYSEKVFIPLYTTLKDVREWVETRKQNAMIYCAIHKGCVATGVLYNQDMKELDAWCVR